MSAKIKEDRFLITPEEAIALREHLLLDEMLHAVGIAKEYRRQPPRHDWGDSLLFATLYHAGLIDGMRRERSRRKGVSLTDTPRG